MWEDIVNNNGKLKGMYLPAIYLDTTVVIDYWLSEALEIPEDEFSMEFEKIILEIY